MNYAPYSLCEATHLTSQFAYKFIFIDAINTYQPTAKIAATDVNIYVIQAKSNKLYRIDTKVFELSNVIWNQR